MSDRNKELLRLIKKDDSEAFKEITDLYFKRVYAFAGKALADPEMVEQAIIAVFKTVWIKRHKTNNIPLEHYIFEITCKEISNLTHAGKRNKLDRWPSLIKKAIEKFDIMINKLVLSRSKS